MAGDSSSSSPPPPGASEATGVRRVLLGELLIESKVITAEQLGEVLGSPREAGKKLGQVLLERGWITEAQLTQTLSLQLSVPWVSLYHIDFSRQLLNRLSREVAEKYCLIPIFVRHVKGQGETFYVAMDDPTNVSALQEVSRLIGLPARPMIASASDIRSAIRVYYGAPTGSANVVPSPPQDATPAPLSSQDEAPNTTRSAPPSSMTVMDEESTQKTRPARAEESEPGRRRPRMVNLTLLDGTTISLPAKKEAPHAEALTARDFVSALRATAHGADASEILGDQVRWEPVVAALLSILLRKGLIADWEFVEELRKI